MTLPRNRRLLFLDIILAGLGAYLTFAFKADRFDLTWLWSAFAVFAAFAVVVTPLVYWRLGLYSHYWRFASVEEMLSLALASLIAALLTGLGSGVVLLVTGIANPPLFIPFVFALLLFGLTAAPRLIERLSARRRVGDAGAAGRTERVLIVGAGFAGAMIARELSNPDVRETTEIVGFVDDDPAKRNARILGVRVLGSRDDIPRLARERGVDKVIIAIPSAAGRTLREIKDVCDKAGLPAKTIPGVHELLDDRVTVSQIRDVQIEDLLRRQPVKTNVKAVGELLRDRVVLVTGGGGSIGSELCRQVLRCNPARLIILGHGENSIFNIENELRAAQPEARIESVIADVRFAERVQSVFAQHRPSIVFHAAAHKHVPLMERNPSEAITNNVVGTRNVIAAALASGVERFVMISTDKAVNPTSMMGASKRVAELLIRQAARRSERPYVAVRFGNVLGSRGSVVLTFKQQIAAGGPVTVTDPDITRFFMTIPEAVQLVLQAAVMGKGGEVFALDMGEPIKIADLASSLIQLSGLEVGKDIEIKYTGLRPGEKLHEELFAPGEDYKRTEHEKIFIAGNIASPLPDALDASIDGLAAAALANSPDEIVAGLRALVPGYSPESLLSANNGANHHA